MMRIQIEGDLDEFIYWLAEQQSVPAQTTTKPGPDASAFNPDESHNYAGGPATFELTEAEMKAIAILSSYTTYAGPHPLADLNRKIEFLLGESLEYGQVTAQIVDDRYDEKIGEPSDTFELRFVDDWEQRY